jgi:hypothetical protein
MQPDEENVGFPSNRVASAQELDTARSDVSPKGWDEHECGGTQTWSDGDAGHHRDSVDSWLRTLRVRVARTGMKETSKGNKAQGG